MPQDRPALSRKNDATAIHSQKRIRQRRGRGALEKRLRYRVRWRLKRSLVKSAAVLLALGVASSAAEMQRRSAEDRRVLKSGRRDPPRSKLRMRRKKCLVTGPIPSRDIERRVFLRVHVRAGIRARDDAFPPAVEELACSCSNSNA